MVIKSVMKFGGTSLATAARIKNCAHLAEGADIVVLSAMDKTTRALCKLHDLWRLNSPEVFSQFQKIKHFHITVLKDLSLPKDILEPGFSKLENFLKYNAPSASNLAATKDHIMSFGEYFSVCIFCAIRPQAKPLFAQEYFITNNTFGAATPDLEAIKQELLPRVFKAQSQGKQLVTEGFVGTTAKGETTTLGFEGSDYTATTLAALLKSTDITIWSDVPGIFSADPRYNLVPRQIKKLDYKQAQNLAQHGVKVLHPRTLDPLLHSTVSLYVRSSLQPKEKGTHITPQGGFSPYFCCGLHDKRLFVVSNQEQKLNLLPENVGNVWLSWHHENMETWITDPVATLNEKHVEVLHAWCERNLT